MDIIENNIDKLITLIEERVGINSVIYIELISVEIKENSFFKIAAKGYSTENYFNNVKYHLKDDENSSLLLMKHNIGKDFEFLHTKIDVKGKSNYPDGCRIYKYDDNREYHKSNKLPYNDIKIEWDKWLRMAQTTFHNMQYACLLHSDLTIPLSRNSINIISAIWVFFSKPVCDTDLLSLEKTLQTGIYEYIIYTLLPDKIQQLERQETFNNIWHNTNHLLGSVHDRISDIEDDLIKFRPKYFANNEKASDKLRYLRTLMELTRNIDKIDKKGGYFYDKAGIIRPEININIQNINLFKFIDEILGNFKTNIEKHYADTIRPTSGVYKKLKENLPHLFDTKGLNELFSINIEIGTFYVMLVDILANATKYSCDEQRNNNPCVKIWSVLLNDSLIELHVRNERGICRNDWEIWMKNSPQKTKEHHYGLGIQLSKSILDFYKIKFQLPETCVLENGGDFTEIIIYLKSQYNVPHHIE